MKRVLVLFGLLVAASLTSRAQGADLPEYKVVIKNHAFQPAEITAPANAKFKLLVTNQDGSASEFESNDFNREKVVLPSSTVTVFVGPLAKGNYKFFDDFHQDTGKGVLIVQ